MSAAGASWYLVCYDVRDPKRLRRCAKHMEGNGTRIQYSTFRCLLSPRQARQLQWELTQILEPEDEALLIPLCDRCISGIRISHSSSNLVEWPLDPPTHQVV